MPKNGDKILFSVCLLGERVRYDAQINKLEHNKIDNWLAQGWLLSCCPEVCRGLPTPRSVAEIQQDGLIKTALGWISAIAIKREAYRH
jgi:uncharacterized protein YbbK (DUF523 family)